MVGYPPLHVLSTHTVKFTWAYLDIFDHSIFKAEKSRDATF